MGPIKLKISIKCVPKIVRLTDAKSEHNPRINSKVSHNVEKIAKVRELGMTCYGTIKAIGQAIANGVGHSI